MSASSDKEQDDVPPAAPRDYDALRALLIERKPAMPKRLAQVAAFAVDRPDDVTFGTVAVIAEQAGVQPSTLVRFAQSLGYQGFSELQDVFRARLRERWPDYDERLEVLRRRAGETQGAHALFGDFVDTAVASLLRLRNTLSPATMDEAARAMARAKFGKSGRDGDTRRAERKARQGKFELANGGTLFLDEIGDLPLPLQAKLLRVLQEQEIEPLGSNQVKALNVRVIVATHIDLEARVAAGQFRDDLYYRLNVLALRLPPLRERREDIPALVEHLLDDIANRSGQAPMELAADALTLLAAQPWSGNVRELRNLLERAQLDAEDGLLDAARLGALLGQPRVAAPPAPASAPPPAAEIEPLAQSLATAERSAIERALSASGGNRQLAAARLGISRAGLYAKLAQHGLGRHS